MRSTDPLLGRVAEAIEAGRTANFSLPERRWIDRIEQLRTKLEISDWTLRVAESEYSGDPGDTAVTVDRVGDVCRSASLPPLWTGILFSLLRRLHPERCLELGTCLGISAAYQAAALDLNGGGRLLSLEGSRERADLARRNLGLLGLERVEVRPGRFMATLDRALSDLGRVDYAFIDGHHDGDATERYFEQVAAVASERAVLVFDDIRWSDAMRRAWRAIAADSRVGAAVELGPMGLCVLGGSVALDVALPLA